MRIAVIAHGLRVAGGRSVAQNIIASLSRIGGAHEYLLVMPKGVVEGKKDLCAFQ